MRDPLDHEQTDADLETAQRIADEAEGGTRAVSAGWTRWIIPVIAASWSVFQLLISSFLLLDSTMVRSIHLAFAICLVFLSHPLFKKPKKSKFLNYFAKTDRYTPVDIIISLAAALLALYITIDYVGLSMRQGTPLFRDILFGFLLLILLLEAARRALGPALPIVAIVFILYSFSAPTCRPF